VSTHYYKRWHCDIGAFLAAVLNLSLYSTTFGIEDALGLGDLRGSAFLGQCDDGIVLEGIQMPLTCVYAHAVGFGGELEGISRWTIVAYLTSLNLNGVRSEVRG